MAEEERTYREQMVEVKRKKADIDRRYQRTYDSKHKKEYAERKRIAEYAHKELSFKCEDDIAYATELLSWSDKSRKKGHLNAAYDSLATVGGMLDEGSRYRWPDEESKKKIAQATVDRSARLFYLATKDRDETGKFRNPNLVQKTRSLMFDLEQDYKIKPRRPKKNLESAVAVVGLIGGLFFLSPNITGNVIGNASVGVSNIVGALMFVVGLVGAWRWVGNR